jgi:phenylalanyl-tRNA synthetase beta chain
VDFWDVKGLVEELGDRYERNFTFSPLSGPAAASVSLKSDLLNGPQVASDWPFYEPGQGAAVWAADQEVGHLGQLSAAAHKALGLKAVGGAVFCGELDLTFWPAESPRTFQSWSSFPGTFRDLAILVGQAIPAQAVLDQIWADRAIPLTRVLVFDVYQGDNIPKGKKSLALRLYFQSRERTLTDELVNGYFKAIAVRLGERLAATLRS